MPSEGFIAVGLTKIVQTPALMVMLSEDLTYRQIFLDGRELPKGPNPAWMGYRVGHWEGDTRVVESTGYNDLPGSGMVIPTARIFASGKGGGAAISAI